MRRLRAWIGRRRKPPVPVSVEISWNCIQGDQLNDLFVAYFKRHIRPRGDSGPGVRL